MQCLRCRSWDGHGRVEKIYARDTRRGRRGTWDNFAKFCPRSKLREQLFRRGKREKQAGTRRERETTNRGGCCCFTVLEAKLACLSESRSSHRTSTTVRRCALKRVALVLGEIIRSENKVHPSGSTRANSKGVARAMLRSLIVVVRRVRESECEL